MRLSRLSLTNFRNYTRLELNLPRRLLVLQGQNAQGKTNLLEAVHLLATGRSPRAVAERELINWLALEGSLPYARLEGEIGEGPEAQKLEMALELAASNGNSGGAAGGPTVRKQIRINGVPRRGIDLIGRLRVVLFLPEDISLVAGAPSERRRYLDVMLCQISPVYCRALSEYQRVLAQRNSLLRRLREEGGDANQLTFWDEQLAASGGVVFVHRSKALSSLDSMAATRHHELSGGERMRLAYLPGFDPDGDGSDPPQRSSARRRAVRIIEERPTYDALAPADWKTRMIRQLHRLRRRETAAGTSLIGPHRDDVAFIVDGHDLRLYGSRGQQRTAALAMKLAEVQLMREETADTPLLLLDDVMSELDATRRHTLLGVLDEAEQAIVTTTDWSDFAPELLRHACTMHIESGRLSAVKVTDPRPPSDAG